MLRKTEDLYIFNFYKEDNMNKKYYLNNLTEITQTIKLTAVRTIEPFTSLPLNNEDIKIYQELKAKRRNVASQLDGLVFSTIPVEEDSRYGKNARQPEKQPENPEDTIKKELEEKAKIRKQLVKQAKKKGKEYTQEELDILVDEEYAKVHKEDK